MHKVKHYLFATASISMLVGALVLFGLQPKQVESQQTKTVNAQQSGAWSVGINGTPSVNVANSPTVQVGNSATSPVPVTHMLPSDMVTLVSTSTPCPVSGFRFSENLPDGDNANVSFDIPVGKVLVVTSFQWVDTGFANRYEVARLFRVRNVGTPLLGVAAISSAVAVGGNVAATMDLTTGFVVNSNAFLCYERGAPGNVIVQGYLTADN